MMTIVFAAVIAAAQPTTVPAQSSPATPPMEHHGDMSSMQHHGDMSTMQQHGDMGKMSAAECAKCCQEMMAAMHDGHAPAAPEHKHR